MSDAFAPDQYVELFLSDVRGAVEATRCEQQYLWAEYHQKLGYSWREITSGYGQTVGMVADMPVHISLLKAEVNGLMVLFYHDTSQVVDHRLIEDWLKRYVPLGWANHSDATNFCNVVLHAPRAAAIRGERE